MTFLRNLYKWSGLLTLLFFISSAANAQSGLPIINMVDDGVGNTEYSLTLQLLALMTALTLLPSVVLMMTSFVRIIIALIGGHLMLIFYSESLQDKLSKTYLERID